jgi:hypothetical protein
MVAARHHDGMMKPGLRKLALTAHVTVSVGWLGAAAGVLALGVTGLIAEEARTATAAYLGTEVIWRWVIVPLSLLALATGIIQALATPWGLLRHHWVLTKLVLTSSAVILLVLHTNSLLPELVAAATDVSPGVHSPAGHHGAMPPGVHLVVAAGGTLLLLLVTTTLSVYKPWGRTRYGRRKLDEAPNVT